MLVIFKCKSYGNIPMLGDAAIRLIKLMGHSGTVPGAIASKDIPNAISLLKKGIEKTRELEEKNISSLNKNDEPEVALALRAFPLIELLASAEKENCNVMWDKS